MLPTLLFTTCVRYSSIQCSSNQWTIPVLTFPCFHQCYTRAFILNTYAGNLAKFSQLTFLLAFSLSTDA